MKKYLKKHKKVLIILGVAILILFVIWWKFFRVTYDANGIPNPLVSYEYVSSKPEAKLFYPNGKLFQHFGRKQVQVEEGLGVAFVGAIMTTTDTPEDVYSWYNTWLVAHGWKENVLAERVMAGGQNSVKDYERGTREVFDIAMDDPKLLSETLGKKVPTNVTVFEFSYMIR